MPKQVSIDELTFKKMFDSQQIQDKIKQIADDINAHYQGEFVELVVVLKGAFIFAADLIRYLKVEHGVHFVRFSSYEGMESKRVITEKISLNFSVTDKHILVIEDIIDSGNTLNYFINKLKKDNPKSINTATLLFKPKAFKYDYPIKFKGFDIRNEFVIGYGLDLDEKARHLEHIYQLDEAKSK